MSDYKPRDWREEDDPLRHLKWRDGGDWKYHGNWNSKKYSKNDKNDFNKFNTWNKKGK